jgi:hypothetical protein
MENTGTLIYSRNEVELLVTGFSSLEIVVAKLKKYKSPSFGEIPAELIQAVDEALVSVIHELSNSIFNKEELPDQWKESIIIPNKKVL